MLQADGRCLTARASAPCAGSGRARRASNGADQDRVGVRLVEFRHVREVRTVPAHAIQRRQRQRPSPAGELLDDLARATVTSDRLTFIMHHLGLIRWCRAPARHGPRRRGSTADLVGIGIAGLRISCEDDVTVGATASRIRVSSCAVRKGCGWCRVCRVRRTRRARARRSSLPKADDRLVAFVDHAIQHRM